MTVATAQGAAQERGVGSIRGVVTDRDFGAPLPGVRVLAVEAGVETLSTGQGNWLLADLPAGVFTLLFSKDGYVRQVRTDVVVADGQLTEVDLSLPGDFTEMEEFVVQDVLQLGGASELALLTLRFESPALLDSISSELMSRAGASDAADGLKLVAGATVKDGKSAVIRGLPDRYVSSQLGGVRLPSADSDKRAVELDQFPSAAIETIQVSKTFTPDQQGDASGGAVNVVLKSVPDARIVEFKAQVGGNTQVTGRNDFLTYAGGGVNGLGIDAGNDQQLGNVGDDWTGAVGTTRGRAPVDFKLSTAVGDRREIGDGLLVGGFLSLFYERDSSFYDNGVNDSYWVDGPPGTALTPETKQGSIQDGDFKTALFDVTKSSESVQWGGLLSLGLETEANQLGLSYLYTRTAEDTAILAEDTRGKQYYVEEYLDAGPYDPTDPMAPGNQNDDIDAAPYLRSQTLEYTERWTDSLQLHGHHVLGPQVGGGPGGGLELLAPELDWRASLNSATANSPDKRQFASLWKPASFKPGVFPFVPDTTTDPTYESFLPSASVSLGNLQRVFTRVDEDSEQLALDLTLPFEQWDDVRGYVKVGFFDDSVDRRFDQNTFTNGDDFSTFQSDFDQLWSDTFPFEDHDIDDPLTDVDYRGSLETRAYYAMADMPLGPTVSVVAGARFESNDIGITNTAEANVLLVDPSDPTALQPFSEDANASSSTDDVLPSIGVIWEPNDRWSVRVGYAETVARQTFKELSPVIQQEFVGGPIFIGNPLLEPGALRNYDLRVDYKPYPGGLVSASWFHKDVEDPIELIQVLSPIGFSFTTPVNYPEGTLSGVEFEVRQDLGRLDADLEGLRVGANATFIDGRVTLRASEAEDFAEEGFAITERDMLAAPEFLYNLFATYDLAESGTRFGLFYTVQGDTLVAGAGINTGNFVPDVYAKEVGTLNLSVSQRVSERGSLELKVKNITNPVIEEVYRSEFIEGETVRTSFTRGIDVSLGISFSF